MTDHHPAPGAPRHFEAGGVKATVRIAGAESEGRIALVEHAVAAGVLAAPPHVHTREDEALVLVEGALSVRVSETLYQLSAGEAVFKPRGLAHAVANFGPRPARFLVIWAPAGLERHLVRWAQALAGAPPLPAEALQTFDDFFETALAASPEMARLAALWKEFGLVPPRRVRGL